VIDELPISYHALNNAPSVARIALTLERRSAYDAAYLALAQELDAELWTLDGPLARNAKSHGYPVHLIESATAAEPAQHRKTQKLHTLRYCSFVPATNAQGSRSRQKSPLRRHKT
jgi:hypothetical protein